MNRNEGNVDRVVRAAVGVILIGAAVLGVIGPWGWIGIVPLVTAAVGWCPLYAALGMNTCGMKKAS
jgi:hypothetical protein